MEEEKIVEKPKTFFNFSSNIRYREKVTILEIIGTILSFIGALVVVNDEGLGSAEDSVIDFTASTIIMKRNLFISYT